MVFYPYQEQISDTIITALLQNLRLTTNATEADIKKLKLVEIPIEISRQSGKTTAVVLTVEFIMIYLTKLFNRRLHIAVFAPQQEQANTDLDRLKEALNRSNEMFTVEQIEEDPEFKERNNQRLVRLPNGSDCYIFPISSTSKPESKTFDLMIFEESQDLNDLIVQQQIWPMGAATNSPRVYIGTAGIRICYFRKIGTHGHALKLYFEEIAKQRRAVYQQTGDARHLIYEQYVRQEIEKHGLDADEVQRPYFGKWLIGTGQFTTEVELEALVSKPERKPTFHFKKGECFAGIDTAKHPDSTVVTITRLNKETGKRDLLNWMELRGENYQDQFDIITGFNSKTGEMTGQGFLDNYNVMAVAIDSTGQGDFMPDLFERHTEWQDEKSGLYRIKFSLDGKDKIYKNLKASIKQSLITLPGLNTKMGEKFKQQMLDLQQEYKGQFLTVHHPSDASNVKQEDLHDDFPDSLALAEISYAKYYSDNEPQFAVVSSEPERSIKKDEESGNVTDSWPGELDDDWA